MALDPDRGRCGVGKASIDKATAAATGGTAVVELQNVAR
jgi:hypothetical protein